MAVYEINIFSEGVGFVSRVQYLKSVAKMLTLCVQRLGCRLVCGQLVCYGTQEVEVIL